MDSHIVLPKGVLKQFWDVKANHKMHIYNVESKQYYTEHPLNYNTKEDYYSLYVEDALNKEIERRIGIFISKIKTTPQISCGPINDELDLIKKYMCSLLCRSPQMGNTIRENVIFGNLIHPQLIHDWAAMDGLDEMQRDKFWDDFSAYLFVCKNDEEFVLSSVGYAEFICNWQITFVLPLAPKFAACLFWNKDGRDCQVALMPNYVEKINLSAIKACISKGKCEIIASKEQIIKDLMKKVV